MINNDSVGPRYKALLNIDAHLADVQVRGFEIFLKQLFLPLLLLFQLKLFLFFGC